MSLILSGTDGLSDIDGTAATPAIRGTDTNTGIFFPAADTIAFSEGGTEVARFDSAGNLGIGTTTPAAKLVIDGGTSTDQMRIGNGSNYYSIGRESATTGFLNFYGTQSGANGYVFGGINGERMRIDSSGNLLVNTTSTGAAMCVLTLKNAGNSTVWSVGSSPGNTGFAVVNQSVVGVILASGATSWASVSDERVKTDLKPIENAVEKVSTLRSVTGRYKTDEEGKSRSFLIAQDVQKVLPEAINADDPEQLGVQYTDVIPLLTAAIKELKATVDAQAARIAALEAAKA
jgi:hypothetical protein